MSRSEKEFYKRAELPPTLSKKAIASVSEYRRASLNEEFEEGKFRDGSEVFNKKTGKSDLGNATYSIKKQGQLFGSSDSTGTSLNRSWQGGQGNSLKQTPDIYSPLWLTSNMNLPRDRITINAWCRAFFALNPIVHNSINLHSTYPIGKISIKSPDPKINEFFEAMCDEIDLMNVLVQIAQEYWLLGEAFVYAELDNKNLKWSRLLIQNPDYMVVNRSVVSSEPLITMRPDENLKRIVISNKPADIEQRKKLNPHITECVKRGENIPLDNFYVSHIARKISPYETRGTGLPVTIFRQLMGLDLIRESKFVQFQSLINPVQLIKIGGSNDYRPTMQDLEAYRAIFEQAQYDKDMKIFTHDGVTVDILNRGSGIYDTSNDVTQLIKEIYIGLMVPSVVLDGGSDTTYANGGVALDVLKGRYMEFRNMLSSWLRRKIFAPISKLNGFYEKKNGVNKLIVPEIDWNYMSLFDTADYTSLLKDLASGEQKKVAVQTLYRSLGLEYEEELRKIKKEDIKDAIRKKELMSLEKMPLNELRALNDDDEIPEVVESPLPGENHYEAGQAPGGDAGGLGLPGGDMGGGLGGGMDLGGGGGLPSPPSGGLDLGGGSPGGDLGGGAQTPAPPA